MTTEEKLADLIAALVLNGQTMVTILATIAHHNNTFEDLIVRVTAIEKVLENQEVMKK